MLYEASGNTNTHGVYDLSPYVHKMSIDTPSAGRWPDSPSKTNTNLEPHGETLPPVGLVRGRSDSQEVAEDMQNLSKEKDPWKKHKVAMLPPEIIERSVIQVRSDGM